MSKKIIGGAVKGEKEEILTLLLKLIVDHTIPDSKTTVFYKKKKDNLILKQVFQKIKGKSFYINGYINSFYKGKIQYLCKESVVNF